MACAHADLVPAMLVDSNNNKIVGHALFIDNSDQARKGRYSLR